jgi:small subunit ribosomal protein S15
LTWQGSAVQSRLRLPDINEHKELKENMVENIKTSVIKTFQAHSTDTGSSAVQVALLTERINHLNKHFVLFPKDYASRTGLMKMVGHRRSLLAYIKRHSTTEYQSVIERLGLRR